MNSALRPIHARPIAPPGRPAGGTHDVLNANSMSMARNEVAMMRSMYGRGPMSRQDLLRATGFTNGTLQRTLERLARDGQVLTHQSDSGVRYSLA